MFEYLNTLNKAQREAATHIYGPLLMIAGAGSGKTTTLINRVAYMVDSGIDPKNILLLTFTNAAADNMVRKAASLSNERCKEITACTFHSFCAMMLRKYGSAVGVPSDFAIILPSEDSSAIKLTKSKLGFSQDKEVPKAKDIADIVSVVINSLVPLSDVLEEHYGDNRSKMEKVALVIKEYNLYKRANNFYTYDDLLFYFYKLLKACPDLRERLEEQYRYVSVDEYQDTNRIQEAIVMLMTEKYRNLAVVGDDYQSIYRFRGAEVSNIIEFEKRIGVDVKTVLLDTNYRSVKEILDVANEVMEENAHFGFPKKMKSARGASSVFVEVKEPGDDKKEFSSILKRILDWRDDGKNLSEFAVLSRSSKDTSLLEVLLAKEGTKFEKLGGTKFLERQCVIDMLSFFRVYVNNSDELAWFHILDVLPGVGEAYASAVVDAIKFRQGIEQWKKKRFYNDLSLLMHFVEKTRKDIAKLGMHAVFSDTVCVYKELRGKKIDAMKTKDYDKILEAKEELAGDLDTISILKEMYDRYDTIQKFLDSVTLDATPQVPTEGAVVISTIHSAKGLEWEHVEIANCLDGCIPDEKSGSFGPDYDEELRCFYVAMTRAKDELVLNVPIAAFIRGNYYDKLCPFIKSSVEKNLFGKKSDALKDRLRRERKGSTSGYKNQFSPVGYW